MISRIFSTISASGTNDPASSSSLCTAGGSIFSAFFRFVGLLGLLL